MCAFVCVCVYVCVCARERERERGRERERELGEQGDGDLIERKCKKRLINLEMVLEVQLIISKSQ